jgi:CheY-like chemotaxis protein
MIAPRAPMQKHHVLLVEDNRVHREVACAALEKYGFTVVQARDGEEALQRLKQERFSLVLMDVEMPWMNGIRAAEKMREMKRDGVIEDMPIIALTADHRAETHDLCLRAGMREVIPKHIWKPKWEHLIWDRLEEWLG